jgi:5'-nucleotidase / UDP-sugar diphosphatase
MYQHPAAGALVTLLAVTLATLSGGCTYEKQPVDLRNQDVRLLMIHTSDVHSRLFPYDYAPNLPDRNLGLLSLPGLCKNGVCTSDTGRSCTQDSNCQAFPTASVGGLSRMATMIKRTRQGAARVLHLDSGDMFQGAPVFNVFSGETEIRSMGLLGVQGMALGNHEFDKGAQMLGLQLMNNGPNFPILAANYEWADPEDQRMPKLRRFIQPYAIYNAGGLRVGVIGLGNLSSLNSAVEGDNSLGLRALDAKQAVRQLVPIVRPQVDLLVLVSHLGPDDDAAVSAEVSEDANQGLDPNMDLAAPGVDLVLGGHLHVVYNPPIDLAHYDKDGTFLGRTVIVNSGAFSKFVGVLDLVVRIGDPGSATAAGRRSYIKSYTFHVDPVADRAWRTGDPEDPCDPRVRCTPQHPNNAGITCPWPGPGAPPRPSVVCIPENGDMARLLEPYSIGMKQLLNLGQVYAVVPCPAGSGECPKVERNDPGGGDSQLGNLVASSMRLRRRVEADFGLTNSLGIRADFESGPLTLEQMYNVFPFENTITTMFLSGDEILQMLDFVAERSAERGCRTQTQVSGIAFTMVCSNPPRATWTVPRNCSQRVSATADQKKSWVGPYADDIALGDSCRGKDGLSIDYGRCQKLDCFRTYKAAVNDFISVGGSGFVVLKRNTTRFNTGISLRDSLIDYIRGLGSDPRYRCAPADGKWRNIKGTGAAGPFDYSNVSCLIPEVERSDGRILPVVR